jgi:sugar phosphate isomerase/epimerase
MMLPRNILPQVPKNKLMRLGLSTYSYTWAVGVSGQMPQNPMSALQLIERAAELGFQCVQIADNLPLHSFSNEELVSILKYGQSKKIEIEVGARGLQPENVRKYIAIAKLLRSPILRIVIDGPGFEPTIDEVIETLNSILPFLKENNIKLAIENHDRFKASEFVRMVVGTDPSWVGICLDSVNSMGAGEGLNEVVQQLAPHTINLHLKDFSVKRVWHKMGFVVEGVPAGQGMLNIEWLKKEVELKGNCESAILELWTPPETTLEETIAKENQWVEESINFLNNHF